jgi:hypothetical protein
MKIEELITELYKDVGHGLREIYVLDRDGSYYDFITGIDEVGNSIILLGLQPLRKVDEPQNGSTGTNSQPTN